MVGIGEQGQVAVNVRVDEAGSHDLAGGVDPLRGLSVGQGADGHDPVAAHADVGLKPR